MVSSLCLNSLRLLPASSHRRRVCPSRATTGGGAALNPIIVTGNPPTFVSAPGRRIVAVGDLHGDLDQARLAFQLAGVLTVDDGGQHLWTGEDALLIQVGDVLDRGEDEIAILSLLTSLDIQAKAKGGAVFQINGNHETINVEGDYRYVETGGFYECASFLEYMNGHGGYSKEAFVSWHGVSRTWRDNQNISSKWGPINILERQKGVIARSLLFSPGGPIACELARHPVALKVNDWIFCHGGLLPHHVDYGIEKMNMEVSQWMMRGLSSSDGSPPAIPFMATRGNDSVVWNRLYSEDVNDSQSKQIQGILKDTLELLGAKAMVVGHTPQDFGANCKYDCSIWRIDVGMSSGVNNSRPEVLEIIDDKARVLRSRRDMFHEFQIENKKKAIEL